MTNKEFFLETADKIGNRLIKNAMWEGDKCTWNVMAPDRDNPQEKKAKQELGGGAVYQGSAGIVLFLNELSKYSNNKTKIIETAEGAIKYAIEESKQLQNNSFGFHSGRVGISYAAAMFALASGKEKYLDISMSLLEPLKGNEEKDYGWDVIGGAAGAIPPLLIINEHLKNDMALSIAESLGNNLIKKANMEPTGWSWGGGNTNVRNLCGLAHGAAGAGHAFMELYNYTGLSKYLYAAEQAFLYERQFFNEESNNWPDFRYSELNEYVYYNKIDELKIALKNGTLSAYQTKYMSAWCHGAPGIGLTRLRVFELTKNDVYGHEALKAIEGTKISLTQNKLSNYSLCHGMGGNSETLIYGYEILKDGSLLKIVEDIALEGIEKFEKNNLPWPCGTMGSVSDPSLMLGEAGIGYYFLRLFDKKVPSALLPSLKVVKDNSSKEDDGFKELQRDYVEYYFGNTLKAFEKENINIDLSRKNEQFKMGQNISDVTYLYKPLKENISTNNTDANDIVKEIFNYEKSIYQLTLANFNFSEEYADELKAGKVDNYNLDEIKIKLKPSVRLIESNWNWQNWLNENDAIELSVYKEENYTLLFKNNNKIHTKLLSPLTYLILKSFERTTGLEDILSQLADFIEIEDETMLDQIKQKVIEQIREAYNAGIVSLEKNIPGEIQITEVVNSNLTSNIELLSMYQKAKFKIQQIIQISNQSNVSEDILYESFKTDMFFNDLLTELSKLHIKHYFEREINNYLSESGKAKEIIFHKIINDLEQIFRLPEYYVIEQ